MAHPDTAHHAQGHPHDARHGFKRDRHGDPATRAAEGAWPRARAFLEETLR